MRPVTFASALLGAVVSTALAAPQSAATHSMHHSMHTTATHSAASAAAPTVGIDDGEPTKGIVKVAYGQQIQNNDQANHWVVWMEGRDACPPLQVLGLITSDPCNSNFTLPGTDNLEFAGCDNYGEPHVLLSEGKYVRACKKSKTKSTIRCHDKNMHNVIKRGRCADE
ncbi:hypothetical protein F5Y10DRAFT_234229 [Nemania abortiva]|nr:hypothetical protein F5Y10DRAFT_234229 [Nemania abortiva]